MSSTPKISAPASKSYLQRALAISALAEGESILENISWCNDALAAKQIIEDLGCSIQEEGKTIKITHSGLKFRTLNFNALESGLSIRMFSPIFALSNKEIFFTGTSSLKKRPIHIISEALSLLDVEVKTVDGFLPLRIKGPIKAQEIEIDASLSSQLLTGLLIALPLAKQNSIIKVNHLKSKPYIDMTLRIIREFGGFIEHQNYSIFKIKGNQKYKAIKYRIEGDWSAAAFFLVLGSVKGSIEVDNLDYTSKQADKAIIDVLKDVGAIITIKKNSIKVENDKLNSFYFDATHSPDLIPPLAALASQCKGISQIKGISRLIHKESNRADVLKKELTKIGIAVNLQNDSIYIEGGEIKSGEIDSHNDHRIAMLGGIMNLFSNKNIIVKNKETVQKSYPDFFENLEKIKQNLNL